MKIKDIGDWDLNVTLGVSCIMVSVIAFRYSDMRKGIFALIIGALNIASYFAGRQKRDNL